jgi:hypothetical protein
MTAYIGGAYEVSFGQAYIGYCEFASTYYTNVFADAGSGSWWNYASATSSYLGSSITSTRADASNCWTDSTYTVDVIDQLPSNIADMAGLVELYSEEIFSF